MANIAGSYNSNQSYNPKFVYTISYSETGRSATAVTYNFSVSMTRTNGSYGYDIIINWNIGGATGSKTILAANSGAASASTSFSVTCSTNASGGTLAAQIWTSSSTDGTHWMNKMDTGAQTVNKSTFNTAPSLSGSVTANGSTSNNYTGETTKAIAVSWPAATDANSNLSGYRLRVSVNGGGYTELTRTNTSTRSYTHNVADYGEGTTFKYAVDAYDSYSTWSGTIHSGTVTKNKLTASTISTSATIGYMSANGTKAFTVSGGSNTDGSAISSRVLTCDGITVYNGSISTGTVNLTIFVSGTTPTGPYIKFADLKTKFASASYKGTLTFKVTTYNNYGTGKTNSTTMAIDLRTNPNAVSSCSIVEGTASTAYRTVSSTGNSYFLPDGSKVIRVSWSGGSGKLGEAITYALYVAYGSGSWQMVAQQLSSSTTYYDHKVPKQTSSVAIKYMVRVVTGYSYYSDNTTASKTLHYYSGVSLSTGAMTRTATDCTVAVTVKSNSSIPNINTVGTWVCYNTGTTTSVSSDDLTQAQTSQNVVATSLTDSGVYDLKVTYKDDTGFSSDQTATITIPANSPVFFVNKYGVGVNGVKANASYSLNVSGPINIGSYGKLINFGTERPWSLEQGGTAANSSLNLISSNDSKSFKVKSASAEGIDMYVTNTGASLTVNGGINSTASVNTPMIELRRTDGVVPYIDFSNDASTDYDMRLELTSDDRLTVRGGEFLISENYIITSGASGWRNSSYGGGWYMTDATWIRSYGSKQVYINSLLRADGGLQVGANTDVVSKGDGTNGWYARFYDGTQICVGWYSWGNVAFTGDQTSGNIWGNTSVGTNGKVLTFPANFVSAPYVATNTTGNGYIITHASATTTSNFTFRIWSNYSTTMTNVGTTYIAIGRWK